jgi:hypothetical protein
MNLTTRCSGCYNPRNRYNIKYLGREISIDKEPDLWPA